VRKRHRSARIRSLGARDVVDRTEKPPEFVQLPRASSGIAHALIQGENPMKTILVVDDDEGIRTVLRRVLEELGHSVQEAACAEDALEVLKAGRIDMALCDVLMPGHDGVWLTDQILSHHPGIPVALATGLVEMDPSVTLQPGVVGYLVKPFRRQAIADLLHAAFEAPSPKRPQAIDLTALDAF
jgi:CheY-like chemotaxis protein